MIIRATDTVFSAPENQPFIKEVPGGPGEMWHLVSFNALIRAISQRSNSFTDFPITINIIKVYALPVPADKILGPNEVDVAL